MSLPEETTLSLHKNTIQYLHKIAEKVPSTLNVLKSYYASKFRISELQTKIRVETSRNKLDARCPQCCLKLSDTEPSFTVRPEIKRSKFARKVLKKVDSGQALTKYQAKYLKKTDLKLGNQLVITCNFCKKEVSHYCQKPEKVRGDVHANEVDNQPTKKKSKKKKDKFCGLQQEAVAAAQIRNPNNGFKKKILQINTSAGETVTKETVHKKFMNRNDWKKQKQFKSKLKSLFKENKNVNVKKNNLARFLESLSK